MVAALPARLASPRSAVPRSISGPFGMRHGGVARAFVNRHMQTGPLRESSLPFRRAEMVGQRTVRLLDQAVTCGDAGPAGPATATVDGKGPLTVQ